MKPLLLILFFIGLIPLRAEEVSPALATSEALRTSKIAKLELNKATFEKALAVVRTEWERQHPTLDFPVSLAEYQSDGDNPQLITISLHEVPFIKALKYIGDTSHRRLVKRSELLTFEDFGLIIEDWITKSHPASEELLKKLGLGKKPTPEELSSVYAQYGVKLDDWMKISYSEGVIIVTAFEQQQEQIAGINLLLSKGYKITKEAQQSGVDQPAIAPESKSEGDETPKSDSKVRPQ